MKPPETFLGRPVRSLQTMLRVISEDDGRLPTVVPDGIYGQTTMNAVSSFQRSNGLPTTGITDQATWEAIVMAYEDSLVRIGKAQPIEIVFEPGQIFRRGDHTPYLYLLQSMLTVLSQTAPTIGSPPHSGMIDDRTAEALAAFQILAGLPPTGELDRITWKYLVQHFTQEASRIAGASSR